MEKIRITKIINDILINIFGSVEVSSLKTFFQNVIGWDADIIVFTTRRSHLLFCLFNEYILNPFKTKRIKFASPKKYITDKALFFFRNDIENKRVLVVDDILVHGRALESVTKEILVYKPQKIEQYVFAKSNHIINNNSEPSSMFCNIESKKNILADNEWKLLSNQIVASLILTSTPYASYIFSLKKEMSYESFKMLKNNLDSNLRKKKHLFDTQMDLTLNEYHNNSPLTKILSESVEAYIYPADFSSNSESAFLRIYYNKLTETCVMMPFYFLGSYTEDELKNMCADLFKNNDILEADALTQYRILTAFYSYVIIGKLSEQNIIDNNDWEVLKNYTELSYYKNFFADIKKAIKKGNIVFPTKKDIINCVDDSKDYCAENLKFEKQLENNEDVYLNEFKKIVQNNNKNKLINVAHTTETLFLHEYIKNVNESEEKYISDCLNTKLIAKKQAGLSFEFVKLLVNYKSFLNFELSDLFSKCLNGADTGLITISPNCYFYNGEKYYSNFLITGEQVCRLYQNEILIFLNELKKIYNDLSEKDYACFNDFVIENIKYITNDESIQCGICKQLEDLSNESEFVLNNLYENVYTDDLKIFLENLFI